MSVLLMARGCGGRVSGGGGGSESISVALNNTAFTGQQGSTSTRTLTLTRVGGYTGTVSFAVTGLPTGTTAGFSPSTLSGATLTTTVTLTHAIDASLVTADAFTITASGSGVTDATVDGAVTVIEPVDPDAFFVNQPAGFTTLQDVSFSTDFDSSTVASPTTVVYDGVSFTKYATDKVQVEVGEGVGGVDALRLKHYSGTTATYSGAFAPQSLGASVTRCYTAFAFRVAADFQTEASGHKIFYPKMSVDGGGAGNSVMINLAMVTSATSGLYRWNLQQAFRWTGSAFSQAILTQNINTMTFDVDTDYRIEIELQMETPNLGDTTQDGIVRMWASTWNGATWDAPVLILEYTDVRFGGTNATTRRFTALTYDVYRGGSGSPTLTADARLYFSRVYWSTP